MGFDVMELCKELCFFPATSALLMFAIANCNRCQLCPLDLFKFFNKPSALKLKIMEDPLRTDINKCKPCFSLTNRINLNKENLTNITNNRSNNNWNLGRTILQQRRPLALRVGLRRPQQQHRRRANKYFRQNRPTNF